MDRSKYTTISHRGLAYASPMPIAKMELVIDLLDLPAGGRVADFGAGKAELSIRLIERYGVQVTAIERASAFVEEARQRAAGRVPATALMLHEGDAAAVRIEPGSLDLAVCIGATEVHGGYAATLAALRSLVRPGGRVLVGEGYWKREPPPEYLVAIGAAAEEFASHADNVAAGVALDLLPAHAVTASEDDWDDYEWRHALAVERWASAHPDDPDKETLLARIRSWRDAYLRWGRDALGFGLYLFERPSR